LCSWIKEYECCTHKLLLGLFGWKLGMKEMRWKKITQTDEWIWTKQCMKVLPNQLYQIEREEDSFACIFCDSPYK
jgi:hypothetical protein